jgi:hypothetical protein
VTIGRSVASSDGSTVASDRVDLLAREVADLRSRVAVLEAASPPIDDRFLFAVAHATKGTVFTASELKAHRMVDAELAAAIGSATPKQIGLRLLALRDHPRANVVLRRVDKRTARGRLWYVQGVAP